MVVGRIMFFGYVAHATLELFGFTGFTLEKKNVAARVNFSNSPGELSTIYQTNVIGETKTIHEKLNSPRPKPACTTMETRKLATDDFLNWILKPEFRAFACTNFSPV